MARKRDENKEADVRDKSAPYAKFGPKKGKRLLKVSSSPDTWVEIDANASQREIEQRIQDYRSKNPTLREQVMNGDFNSISKKSDEEDELDSHTHKKSKFDYAGPIYSIPKVHPHMFK